MPPLYRFCVAALLLASTTVSAQNGAVDSFVGLPNGGAANYNPAGNWSLGRPPGASETADITFADANDRTINLDISTSADELDANNSGGSSLTLVQSAGISLNFGAEYLGGPIPSDGNRLNSVNFVQSGGTNAATKVYVGGLAEYYGGGSYTLSGGTLQTQTLTVGYANAGSFKQSGNSTVVTTDLSVAEVMGSTGVYELNAGTFHALGSVQVGGDQGNGTFSQNGGLSRIDGRLLLGYSGGSLSAGKYLLSSDAATLHAGQEILGDHSVGNIVQSAGTNLVDGQLEVGHVFAGNYQLSGGTLSAATITVGGIVSQGVFTQNGGTATVAGPLAVNFGSSYSLSGGTLSAESINIARGGSFSWSAGTISTGTVSVSGKLATTAGRNKTLVVKGLTIVHDAATDASLNGNVDLTDNYLVIDYTGASPSMTLVGLRSALLDSALVSSTADAQHRIGYGDNALLRNTTFGSQTFTSDHLTEVLASVAYTGDCNLDGKVDVVDLGLLASHWQMSGYWNDGDLNYDGTVNVVDLGLLASNWQAGTRSSQTFADALSSFDLSQTPEPSVLGAAAFALMLKRSRRWSSKSD